MLGYTSYPLDGAWSPPRLGMDAKKRPSRDTSLIVYHFYGITIASKENDPTYRRLDHSREMGGGMPNWITTVVVPVAVGLISGAVGAWIAAAAQLAIQKRQIAADQQSRLVEIQRQYSVEAHTTANRLLSRLSDPASFFASVNDGTLQQLSDSATYAITALALLLPKPTADKLIDFNDGPFIEFVNYATHKASNATPENHDEICADLRQEYEVLLKAYRPIMDEIRELLHNR